VAEDMVGVSILMPQDILVQPMEQEVEEEAIVEVVIPTMLEVMDIKG
jgi:hypothetical protein